MFCDRSQFVIQLADHFMQAMEILTGMRKISRSALPLQLERFFHYGIRTKVGNSTFQGVGSTLKQWRILTGNCVLNGVHAVGIVVEENFDKLSQQFLVVANAGQCSFTVE